MTAEMAHSQRTAAVITVSDRVAAGQAEDASGPALAGCLAAAGWTVVVRKVISDEADSIAQALVHLSDVMKVPLVLTTGGTGIAQRDVTPDATHRVADREVPGIAEALRAASFRHTPHAMLSRATAAIRGATLIVNLPGNPKAVGETFAVLAPVLDHATALLAAAPIGQAGHLAAEHPVFRR